MTLACFCSRTFINTAKRPSIMGNMTSSEKPKVRLHITYSIVARGGPNHGPVNTWKCVFEIRQRTDRHTDTLIAIFRTSVLVTK